MISINKVKSFFRRHGIITFALIGAIFLIGFSLMGFVIQVNSDVRHEMQAQTEAILESSVRLLQNEVNCLKRLTETAADFMNQEDYKNDEDIVTALQEYAKSGNIVRALFVTLDGNTYTNYAGYLGPREKVLDGLPLSEIKDTMLSHPFYDEDLDKVIYGIVTPVTMGKQSGVLISSYDVERFAVLFQNKFLNNSAYVGIVDSKGNVIIGESIQATPSKFGTNIYDSYLRGDTVFFCGSLEDMRYGLSEGRKGFAVYSSAGNTRYCAYAPSDISDWNVAIAVPETVLLTQTASIKKRGIQLTVELIVIMTVLMLIIIVVSHKEQQQVRSILKEAATIDALTGIYNRGAVESKIADFLEYKGAQGNHALFIMDIDCFKHINDNFGHMVGDLVLKQFANQLQQIFGEKDIIGRMGGDEFIALMTDFEDVELVRVMADKITKAFYNRIEADGRIIPTSTSIGISLFDMDGHSFIELYQHADVALYRTKEYGKNGFTFYVLEPSNIKLRIHQESVLPD